MANFLASRIQLAPLILGVLLDRAVGAWL